MTKPNTFKITLHVTVGEHEALDCALMFRRTYGPFDRKTGRRHGVVYTRGDMPAVLVYRTHGLDIVVVELAP